MKTSSILLSSVVVSTLFYSSAQAAVITFGGIPATDNSGLVSNLVPNVNSLTSSNVLDPNNPNFGLFIETFDSATAMAVLGSSGSTSFNTAAGNLNGCALNSTAGGVSVTSSGPSAFAITQGSSPSAAAPANDATCFGFTPAPNGSLPAWVAIDYTNLLNSFSTNLGGTWRIDYLGFYWGSVDTYNDFMFYNSSISTVQNFNPLAAQGGTNPFDTQLLGTSLLNQLGGSSGNQTSPLSNAYVNINFAPNEAFSSLAIRTSGVAGEFDNIVIRVRQVEVASPTTLSMFALGLLGLGMLARRRRS